MASEISMAIAAGNWKNVMQLALNDPTKAQVWAAKPGPLAGRSGPYQIPNNVHGLPLHEALCVEAPRNVVDILCRAYPQALTKRELVLKRLPLHIACQQAASTSVSPTTTAPTSMEPVILLLVQYYKTAVEEVDRNGRTPFHYALERRVSDTVVNACLDAMPNVAKAQDKRGVTPLHLACRHGYSTAVIARLLELHPDGAIIKTDQGKGWTPAQYLSQRNPPNGPEVLQLLKKYSLRAHKQFRTAVEPSSRRLMV